MVDSPKILESKKKKKQEKKTKTKTLPCLLSKRSGCKQTAANEHVGCTLGKRKNECHSGLYSVALRAVADFVPLSIHISRWIILCCIESNGRLCASQFVPITVDYTVLY